MDEIGHFFYFYTADTFDYQYDENQMLKKYAFLMLSSICRSFGNATQCHLS